MLYQIPISILEETRTFLYQCGQKGDEGCALWIGNPADVGDCIKITRVLIPEQIATRTIYGVSVDLTEKAHYTLTDNLLPNERFYIRIHSHPTKAYHSKKDDANMILSHQGAISIVVPDFAIRPIDLMHCAIYQLQHGKGWLQMTVGEIAKNFEVIS